jgi:membrane protein involved in colicin uptake
VKFQSLQDLKHVQKQIAEAQAKAAAEAAARAEAKRKAEADQNLFTRAIGKVQPLPSPNKAHLPAPPRAPVATQREKD